MVVIRYYCCWWQRGRLIARFCGRWWLGPGRMPGCWRCSMVLYCGPGTMNGRSQPRTLHALAWDMAGSCTLVCVNLSQHNTAMPTVVDKEGMRSAWCGRAGAQHFGVSAVRPVDRHSPPHSNPSIALNGRAFLARHSAKFLTVVIFILSTPLHS